MADNKELIDILKKYQYKISTTFSFHIKGDIPCKKVDNALKTFAVGLNRQTIIGFYDTTLMGSGKEGYIFTDSNIYFKETLSKPQKIWYEDIKSVKVIKKDKAQDCDRFLEFSMKDGTTVTWTSSLINKTPVQKFINEVLQYKTQRELDIELNRSTSPGALASGIAMGNYGTVNKLYDEQRFNTPQGHGFAAERANHLVDKLSGKDSKILGDSNLKHGADRLVNGVEIQSKYCQSGSKCISECFENGKMKYTIENGTKPMQIEVPSDKYDAAVKAMEKRIQNGEVPGVTDPSEAKNIVRKGFFKYDQALNIAKAGTVESIIYDSVNGAIIATSAFGVSSAITFATSIWNGEDFNVALKAATYSGIKVGGTAFITSVLASQLSKAGLNSALVGSSEAIIGLMGPKASAVLINAFRSSGNIYGAAAMKSAAKLLRGNVITGGVTVVVLSTFDIVNIFRGRISGRQLFKNITNTTTTVAGGTGGWFAGAALGSMLLPGVGTVIGGVIGSLGGGAAAGKATNAVLNQFLEDDADEMVKIIEKKFSKLAVEYLLNQREAEKCADKLKEVLTGSTLKDMFAASNRETFATNLLKPILKAEVKKRKKIALPTDSEMSYGLRTVLEEISDNMELVPIT